MKKRLFCHIILLAILFPLVTGAQENSTFKNNITPKTSQLNGKLIGERYYLTVMANSKFFLPDDWAEGSVTLTDGDYFEGVKLRYMAFGDQLVVYNKNIQVFFTIDHEIVRSFSFKTRIGNTRKFINLGLHKNISEDKNYFEVLYSGNNSLLAFHSVNELKVTPYMDNSGVIRDIEYRPELVYFALTKDNRLIKMQKSRRTFAVNFPKHKKEIRKTFRQKRLSALTEASFIHSFKVLDESGVLQ